MRESIWRSTRAGLQGIRRHPGKAAIIVMMIALGTGMAAATYEVLRAVVGGALPYRDVDRLVMIWEDNTLRGVGLTPTSYLNYQDVRDQAGALEMVEAFTESEFNLTGSSEPERVVGVRVTPGLLGLTGVSPALGRTFVEADADLSAAPPVILSYGLWDRLFGRDDGVIGRTVGLNQELYTIVGVMPRGFAAPPAFRQVIAGTDVTFSSGDLWVALRPDETFAARELRFLFMMGRLRPAATLDEARAELAVVADRLARDHPAQNADLQIVASPLSQQVLADLRPAMAVLMAAAAIILAIISINVTMVLVAIGMRERGRLAVQVALGAPPGGLAAQRVVTVIVLAVAGLAGAGLVAATLIRRLSEFPNAPVPRLPEATFGPATMAAGLVGVVVVAAVASLLLIRQTRSLSASSHRFLFAGHKAGTMSRRVAAGLVSVQVALAVGSTAMAVQLVAGATALANRELGMSTRGVQVIEMLLPERRYPDAASRIAFQTALLERLEAGSLPTTAATVSHVPYGKDTLIYNFTIENKVWPDPATQPRAMFRTISPDYFEVLGVPLVAGRTFEARDTAERRPVAIVSEGFAKRYWGGVSPIGRRLKSGGDEPWLTVVGIVGEMRSAGVTLEAPVEVFVPYRQDARFTSVSLLAKSEADDAMTVRHLREVVRSVDADMPTSGIRTLGDLSAGRALEQRLFAEIVGLMALLAMGLASAGVYAMTSGYVVGARHELAVRLGIGAEPLGVALRLGRQVSVVLGIGVLAGLPLAWPLMRLAGVGTAGIDVSSAGLIIAAVALVCGAAALACAGPLREVFRLEPAMLLRR